jgi:hypothetical protein
LTAAYQALRSLQARWATTAPEVIHRVLVSFQQALMAIVVLTWLDFRRLQPTLLALVPLVLGAL